MEPQKKKKKSRRLASVFVFMKLGPKEKKHREFLYLNVKRMYKEDGLIYIVLLNNEIHVHDPKRIESLQMRKYPVNGRWGG